MKIPYWLICVWNGQQWVELEEVTVRAKNKDEARTRFAQEHQEWYVSMRSKYERRRFIPFYPELSN